jgi:hypothetical protein
VIEHIAQKACLNPLGLYLACVLLMASTNVSAIDCSIEDGYPNIYLRTQADVDNFQTDFGPCDTITRDLIIEAEGATLENKFTNLFGLSEIVSITGSLTIIRSSVASIEGLSNLQNITGDLHIESQLTGSFANLTGFSSLSTLGGLVIIDTNFLYSLSGLGSLVSLDSIIISDARILTNLQGFPQSVVSNQTGSSYDRATNLDSLFVDLGLKRLRLSGNDLLESLVGLPTASGLKILTISGIPKLTSLDGLSPVSGLEVLSISENPELTSISALAGSVFNDVYTHPLFDETTPSLVISGNSKLSDLTGVPSALPPGAFKDLAIMDNPLITSLAALTGVSEIWGEARFFDNNTLSDCASLSKLMDTVDDGFIGPNEFTSDPSVFPPDLVSPNDELPLAGNAPGCNTIAEILGSSNDEEVFMDGFENQTP